MMTSGTKREEEAVAFDGTTPAEIQGRLNQREIPFKVEQTAPDGALTFIATRGPGVVRVDWAPTLGYPLAEVIDWLASFKADTS